MCNLTASKTHPHPLTKIDDDEAVANDVRKAVEEYRQHILDGVGPSDLPLRPANADEDVEMQM